MAVALFALMMPPALADDLADIAITRADGRQVHFNVELARDDESRAYGLMFRKKLGKSSGMLFVYDTPGQHAFWMKNTLIPLDMLFFDKTGKLVHIHPSATPKSLDAISSGSRNICAVLEINGGAAKKQGLAVGDTLAVSQLYGCARN